jgi:hypothetical protein
MSCPLHPRTNSTQTGLNTYLEVLCQDDELDASSSAVQDDMDLI